jgi:hypothetical protein
MALVFTKSRQSVVGDRKVIEGTITFTGASSYTTGGIATSAADYGLMQLDGLEIMSQVGGEAVTIANAGGTAISAIMLTAAPPSRTQIGAAGDPTGVKLQVRAIGY